MKTYLIDTIDRFKRFSQSLDVQTILCSKAWYVLNEDGDTENLIFQEDGTILVSVNGSTKKYTWKFIPQNQSLNIMHSETEGTMLKPAFMDGKILAFNKIGTKECMFLVDDSLDDKEKIISLDAVKKHLSAYEEREIEREKRIQLQNLAIATERYLKEQELRHKQEETEQKKIETNRLLRERIQERKDAIEDATNRLHSYKRRLNKISDTELGKIAILFIENKAIIDQKYQKRWMLPAFTGIGLIFVSTGVYILAEWLQMYGIGIIAFLISVCSIVLIIIGTKMDENKFQYKQFKKIYNKQAEVNILTKYKFSKELFTEKIQPTMEQYMDLSNFIEQYPTFVENLTMQIKDLESRFI